MTSSCVAVSMSSRKMLVFLYLKLSVGFINVSVLGKNEYALQFTKNF